MENNTNHLLDILKLINYLQRSVVCNDSNNTCTRPILGQNNTLVYNTRPVTFYMCNNQALTITGDDITTSIFRVENIEGNCVTVRLLSSDDTGNLYATNQYATVNINCICAIRCLNDVSLTL